MKTNYFPEDYGAIPDGMHLNTTFIQIAIDEASQNKGMVVLRKGIYLTGSLFLKSDMEFIIEEEAELRGTTDESMYPIKPTRVAGIEMEWPAGLINIYGERNVSVTGKGAINGQGNYWWEKFANMRKDYEVKDLRWAVDYDCFRPRNLIVYDSENICLKEFKCMKSGFWNVHLCYSKNVLVENIIVEENHGPSTDGIDIDSCQHVKVTGCQIDCNDDAICVKAGRDWDGLRVNRQCKDIIIENCCIGLGSGITLGSETSGGICDVTIKNIEFKNSMHGFRIKSARTRGGLIHNINVQGLQMKNVEHPFSILLDWYPKYSYCALPEDFGKEYPKYWETLCKKVPEEEGLTEVKNINIQDVISNHDKDSAALNSAFEILGYPEKPIENLKFQNVKVNAKELGNIKHVKNLQIEQLELTIA